MGLLTAALGAACLVLFAVVIAFAWAMERSVQERLAMEQEVKRWRSTRNHEPWPAALTFREFSCANCVRNSSSYFPIENWSPTDWATALAGEVGEYCNLVKKIRRGDPGITTEMLADELADVWTYADLCAQRHGIDMAEAVVRKFNAVSVRVGSTVKL